MLPLSKTALWYLLCEAMEDESTATNDMLEVVRECKLKAEGYTPPYSTFKRWISDMKIRLKSTGTTHSTAYPDNIVSLAHDMRLRIAFHVAQDMNNVPVPDLIVNMDETAAAYMTLSSVWHRERARRQTYRGPIREWPLCCRRYLCLASCCRHL